MLGGIKFGESHDSMFNSYGKCKLNKMGDLYVNDSSLITESLLKNPQGTIMSIADQNVGTIIKKIND